MSSMIEDKVHLEPNKSGYSRLSNETFDDLDTATHVRPNMAVRHFNVKSTAVPLAFTSAFLLFYVFWQTPMWYGIKRSTNGRYFNLLRPIQNMDEFREPEDSQETRGKRSNLIIVSQGRSGSSFVGQIYNQHPDVLYFYEPFHVLERVNNFNAFIGNSTEKYNDLATMFLREICECKFTASKYLKYLSRPGHFRFSSRVLKSPPFCHPEARKSSLQEILDKRLCSTLEPSELNTVCEQQYRVTAVKALEHRIMGKRIKNIKPLFENEVYENKVVYLVRDPRAVISSMWHGGWISYVNFEGNLVQYSIQSEQFVWYVKRVCNQVNENLESVKNAPNWLKGRLKLLRYEDLILEPGKITKELFRFVNLTMPSEMQSWLHGHMHFGGATLSGKEGAYSTVKNSTIALCKWRLKTSTDMVKVIEHHCGSVMDDLGYLPTHGSSEIQSRVDIPLVTRTLKDELQRYSCG